MLSYDLSQEHEMLRKSIRDFAESEIKPVAQKLDEKEEFSYDLVEKMGKMGLFGITVSPEYGGQGLDVLSYIIAVEELARVDGCQAATVAAENGLGIGPMGRARMLRVPAMAKRDRRTSASSSAMASGYSCSATSSCSRRSSHHTPCWSGRRPAGQAGGSCSTSTMSRSRRPACCCPASPAASQA